MSNKALIIVDYSFDFIDDNGKLTCGKPGQEIETFITQRIKNYHDNQQEIFFLMDLHYEMINFILKVNYSPIIIFIKHQVVSYMAR